MSWPPLLEKTTHLQRRLRAEKRFRWYGKLAVTLSIAVLVMLLSLIGWNARTAIYQTVLNVEVSLDPAIIDVDEIYKESHNFSDLYKGDLQAPIVAALQKIIPDAEPRDLQKLISRGASSDVWQYMQKNPDKLGQTVQLQIPASSDVDMAVKNGLNRSTPEIDRRLNDIQLSRVESLQSAGVLETIFNWRFFTAGDSREPELAGILASLVGSLLTMLVTVLFALPLGIAAAIYLEEFAPKNRFTTIIETNINNLAAVPSIVYGLLGLAIFLGFLGMPRSAPLVGGLVLGLMTMPVIIIATRSSLDAVPPSIREGALALGASPVQAVFHHILPLAMPGIMTGTIIGMARALGETAPLLMIGMVAFITSTPDGFLNPSSVLPVQIFIWADSAERGFVEKTAAGIVLLIIFLLFMNGLALYLRHKFEKKW
ncbi:MAG: phosphate ABC transporter permease PstA [Alphaproteobacteria bacterium]|nr:MAG: phosphate ABC transporter permease PstA [Alphaproteobacteria bacterium]